MEALILIVLLLILGIVYLLHRSAKKERQILEEQNEAIKKDIKYWIDKTKELENEVK